MTAIAFFAAATLLGIDVGWQPTPGGGVEYIIQIPPEAIESLRGEAVRSDIPPDVLREMRTYRIIVGNRTLPQKLPDHPAVDQKATATEKGLAVDQKATASAAPAPLPPNPASKPMTGQPAVFVESAPAESNSHGETSPAGISPPVAEKPWLPLWLTVIALFTSLGANVYLGWIAFDVHRRWRTLVEKAS